MIRPTRRAVALFAAGVPLSLLVLAWDPSRWQWCVDYGALVLIALASDAALVMPARLFRVDVQPPEALQLGEAGAVAVRIDAAGYRRAAHCDLIAEQRGALDPPRLVAVDLAAGGAATVHLPLVPRRRGQVWVDQVWIRWRGPLALAQLVRRIAVGKPVAVLPNIRGVRDAALQLALREGIQGIKVQPHRGEGAEFDALREHAAGLDPRFIDWKHSARHRKLLSKEFQVERNHQIVLAFDTGYLMSEPVDGLPRLDHAIQAGLLLAWISLQAGDLVGAYAFDGVVRSYLRPVRGMAALLRLQHAAAGLDYQHQETNFTLGLAELGLRLRQRALVILFTDFVDTVTAELLVESVERVAGRHVVLFVTLQDPLLRRTVDAAPDRLDRVAEAVVAHDLLQDRAVVFKRLERLGVQCLDLPSRALPTGLINRYLAIKRRGLL